jgi:hypothetical protein
MVSPVIRFSSIQHLPTGKPVNTKERLLDKALFAWFAPLQLADNAFYSMSISTVKYVASCMGENGISTPLSTSPSNKVLEGQAKILLRKSESTHNNLVLQGLIHCIGIVFCAKNAKNEVVAIAGIHVSGNDSHYPRLIKDVYHVLNQQGPDVSVTITIVGGIEFKTALLVAKLRCAQTLVGATLGYFLGSAAIGTALAQYIPLPVAQKASYHHMRTRVEEIVESLPGSHEIVYGPLINGLSYTKSFGTEYSDIIIDRTTGNIFYNTERITLDAFKKHELSLNELSPQERSVRKKIETSMYACRWISPLRAQDNYLYMVSTCEQT